MKILRISSEWKYSVAILAQGAGWRPPTAWGVASRKFRGAPSRHRLAAALFSRRPIANRSRCSRVGSGLDVDGCSLLKQWLRSKQSSSSSHPDQRLPYLCFCRKSWLTQVYRRLLSRSSLTTTRRRLKAQRRTLAGKFGSSARPLRLPTRSTTSRHWAIVFVSGTRYALIMVSGPTRLTRPRYHSVRSPGHGCPHASKKWSFTCLIGSPLGR